MLALPQEYVSSLCEVKSLTNDLLAIGRIIKIDSEALELAGSADEKMPLLQYRTAVKLFVHHQTLATRILVGTVYLSTENFTRIEEVKPLQDFERRGAFRVNTNVLASLTALLSDDEQAALDAVLERATPEEAEEILARTAIEARVMDVSLTGIRLASPVPLRPGQRFFIEFTLLNTPMNLCLRVQRLVRMPRDETHYGCIFFDYTERQMDALCRELFQLQRYEKNRRRNSAAAL